MPKEGLTALAESYGLERNELHQLKVLAESFFDKLREDLLSYAGRSLRMVDLSQTTASFSEFSTDEVAAQHLLFLGFTNQVIAVMRLDDDLARAMIDCMLGGAAAKSAEPAHKMTAVEERVIANTVGAAIVRTAQRVLGPLLHDSVNLRLLRIEHRAGLVADTLAPSEQLVTARVRCDAGTRAASSNSHCLSRSSTRCGQGSRRRGRRPPPKLTASLKPAPCSATPRSSYARFWADSACRSAASAPLPPVPC